LLINIADNFSAWGKNKQASEYSLKALEKAKERYGENHPNYGVALNSYAINLGRLGRYAEAEDAYRKLLTINKGNGGTDNPEYATSLNNLGLRLWEMDQVEEAEQLTIQALKIREKKLGSDHPDCMSSRQRLADIYYYKSWKPLESDSLLQIVAAYWGKRGPKSREYADVLLAQGAFYRYIGEFEKSEQRIKAASAIFNSILGENSWEEGNCLNDLANTYREKARQTQGQVKKELLGQALQCVKNSMATEVRLGSMERINVATLLQNIGIFYYATGQADSAEHYLLRSLALRKKLQGENNSAYGGTLSSLAGIYEMQHRYQEAIDTGLKALTILAETTGKNTEDYLLCARGMGSTLLTSGRIEEAFPYIEEERKAVAVRIKKAFAYLSITEQIKTIQRYKPDFYYSSALDHRHPELARICYNNILYFKGAGLRNKRTLRAALGASPDTTLRQIFDQYILAEKSIAAEYNLPPDQRTRIDSLQNASRDLERTLIAKSPEYNEYINKLSITWQTVQSKLKPGEAAIEFVRYNRMRVIETDTFLYAALVLLPGRNAPVFVPLCQEKAIDTLRQEQIRRDGFPLALYKPSEQSRASSTGKKFNLYDSVWRPLDSLLEGVKRVYYAPDGLLHRVSFAALGYIEKSGGKVFLTDRFELVQMASTRQLVETFMITPVFGKDALVIGEIDYGTLSKNATTRAGSDPFGGFTALETSKDTSEFDKACELFQQNGQEVTALSGKAATETAVLAQFGKATPYRSVCLITHGFFLPDERLQHKMRHLFSEANPMQRSGLVFAGVNKVDSAANYEQDGLLTAQDFAGLNLKGTEVVMIPACQSGLGDVIGSEGVFGLQRAFREAGARYLIISLWDLPNVKTGIFMKTFYDFWLKQGKPVPEAFRLTQRQLRNTKDWDVSDWAGLILIE